MLVQDWFRSRRTAQRVVEHVARQRKFVVCDKHVCCTSLSSNKYPIPLSVQYCKWLKVALVFGQQSTRGFPLLVSLPNNADCCSAATRARDKNAKLELDNPAVTLEASSPKFVLHSWWVLIACVVHELKIQCRTLTCVPNVREELRHEKHKQRIFVSR